MSQVVNPKSKVSRNFAVATKTVRFAVLVLMIIWTKLYIKHWEKIV